MQVSCAPSSPRPPSPAAASSSISVVSSSSTALGVLVAAAKRQRATGGEVVVRSPQPRIRRVFELTGLDRVFDLAS
jgi:anti-anti-sigma factor